MTDNELIELRKRLAVASEKLNSQITQIEMRLQKLNLGVEAWVRVPMPAGVYALGYRRFQGEWQLCVAMGPPEDELTEIRALRETTRQTRVVALTLTANLVDALVKEAHRLTERIEQVLEDFKGVPAELDAIMKKEE